MKNGRKLGSGLLAAAMSFSLFTGSGEAKVSSNEQDGKDEIRVLINGSSSTLTKAKNKYQQKQNFGSDGFSSTVSSEEYKELTKSQDLTVEKVTKFTIAQAKSPKANAAAVPSAKIPWGIKAIYNDPSITSTSGGSGIKVAVLDTGTAKTHPNLAANVEQCKDFTASSTYINNSCADKNGHGTHVSGTVLANGGTNGQGIYGVAPQSKLWAYKVLGDDGSGYSDDIAAAIRHAADQSTSTNSKVILSMSLGASSKDSLITSAVTYANNKGVLIIAAAGNSGSSANTIGYPGALTNTVSVAALENVQENGTYRIANYSSRGNPNTDGDYFIQEKDVEVSAPGSAIESTWYNGGYNTISGTSMATPHVAGLAAKIWSSNGSLSNTEIRTQLQTKAKTYDIKGGIGAAVGDDYASGFGFPRVQ